MEPRAFDLREVAVAPGAERAYDEAEWADALVVVARGEIELEGLCGARRRFARGAVLFLVGLNLRALHNVGAEPAVLLAVSRKRRDTIGLVTDRLYFTDSDEANALIATDPMALLVGFVLDQQVTVQKAFSGPLAIRERIGSLDPAALADADLEPVFRERPAIHRFPGAMAQRVHDLAVHVRDRYDGDAARVWTDAADADQLRANLAALPGFGEMKIKALGSVLAKRFGVTAAQDLVPWHPTLGDVDSAQALADYQAAKRVHKAEWTRAKTPQ
jgi:uncharacterized HhH-GPD family protein